MVILRYAVSDEGKKNRFDRSNCFSLSGFSGLEPSIAGNYTCSSSNLFGEDSIIYTVIVIMPPKTPTLELQYTTANSIKFRWSHPENGGATIQGKKKFFNKLFETFNQHFSYFRLRFEL